MAKKAATPPDYTAAAEKQGESSKEVTNIQNFANRPDQVTPFGNQTWSTQATVDPATGQKVTKWVQNTTLNPASQQALNDQQALDAGRSQIAGGMLNRVSSEFAPTMDWSKFQKGGAAPNAGGVNTKLDLSGAQKIDPSQKYYDQAGDAVYKQFSDRNEPVFQQQQAQMATQLRNQGLNPGDEAYDAQIKNLSQQQNDARTNASLQATQAAGSEAARMQGMDVGAHNVQTGDAAQQFQYGNAGNSQQFNQNLQGANYQTQLRQQQIAEEMQKRGFSLNEINGLLNGQQIGMPNMPGFNAASKSDTVGYSDAAKSQYSAAQDAANASNATISGVANLAGGAMGMM